MVFVVDENCEFVVPQGRVEALVKELQKIQNLFNVRINVQSTSSDAAVQWVTLEGDKVNRRQAKEYVNALVEPEHADVYKMPLLTAYLVENFAIKENLERSTLSKIEIISNDEIKICGSQMAVATALSALEETMRIFGENAVPNPLQINMLNGEQCEDETTKHDEDDCVCEDLESTQESSLDVACAIEGSDKCTEEVECEKTLCEKLENVCLVSSVVAEPCEGSCKESQGDLDETIADVIKTDELEVKKESIEESSADLASSSADNAVNESSEHNPHESLRDFATKLGYNKKQITQALNKLGEAMDQNSLLSELVQASSSAKQLEERAPENSIPPASLRPDPTNLRPVVIDGSNVAMSHGNHQVFSCRGIGYAVDWFLQRGHRQITIFVPAWRKEASKPGTPIINQEVLRRLEQDGLLVWTPSRPINGRMVVCYDDRFIVQLAAETDGVIVSNDNFRDLQNENGEWKKVIQERLLMYSFANDRFMVPDDPSGRHGPRLDEFLCKGSGRPCPYGRKCTYGMRCKYLHPERQKLEDNDANKRQKEEFNVKSLPDIPYGEFPPSYNNIPPHILSKPLPPLPNEMNYSHQLDQHEGAVGYQAIYSQMHLRLTRHFPPILRGQRSSQGDPDRRQVNSDPIYHQRSSGDMSLLPEELHRVMSMPNLDTAGYNKSRRNSLTQGQDLPTSGPGYFTSPSASPRNSMCSPAASPRTSLVFPQDFQVPTSMSLPPPPPPRIQSCHPDALSPRGNPPPLPPQNQMVHAPYEPPTPDPRIPQYHHAPDRHMNARGARQRPMTVYNQQWMLPPQPQPGEHPIMHFQNQGPAHYIPVSASMGLPASNQYQRQYPGQCMPPQYANYPRGYFRTRAPPGDVRDGEGGDSDEEDTDGDEEKRVELFEKLKEIFGDDDERICKVLEENPAEMDADKLAGLMLE